jgi:hypothetical protein
LAHSLESRETIHIIVRLHAWNCACFLKSKRTGLKTGHYRRKTAGQTRRYKKRRSGNRAAALQS